MQKVLSRVLQYYFTRSELNIHNHALSIDDEVKSEARTRVDL